MKALIASEFRCTIYNGEYYLAPKAYSIYKRYSDAFEKIFVCSRFVETNTLKAGYRKADFIDKVINIKSLQKVLLGFYDKEIEKLILESNLVIVRVPSIIAFRSANIAFKKGKKVLAEAMADPWDAYWNHSFLGKCIAPYMTYKMKITMKQADYAIYVTKYFLQSRYPNNNKSIHASNVAISPVSIDILNKRINKIKNIDRKHISLMTAAGVNVRAKGHKYVIEAMRKLKDQGIDVIYYLAGEGSADYLKKVAEINGVSDKVIFLGELSKEEVFKYIDNVDIYIQPSLQEGLPRSVIEAMSRGCLCLGSKTAGIPELLDEECLFDRKSSNAIVEKINFLLSQDLEKYALRNFDTSKKYVESILNERRKKLFDEILKNERKE